MSFTTCRFSSPRLPSLSPARPSHRAAHCKAETRPNKPAVPSNPAQPSRGDSTSTDAWTSPYVHDVSCRHSATETWREMRGQLVQQQHDSDPLWPQRQSPPGGWCHRIPCIEDGCLLLANKPGLGFFERSVVLVVQNNSMNSVGLVLNHPSLLSVDELHIDEVTKSCFGRKALRLGGACSHKSVLLLHGQPQIEDAYAVCPGIYTGGLTTSVDLVKQGACDANEFCLLAGYTSWQPGQLDFEVATASWVPVSASPKLILDVACDDVRCRNAWQLLFSYVSEPERRYVANE